MAKKIFKTGSGKTTYPSDVTDEEWAFCAPYLTLMKEEAPQREHSLRSVFNAVRYMIRAGCPWRMIPNDLAPWSIVFQQAHRCVIGAFDRTAILLIEPTNEVLDQLHAESFTSVFIDFVQLLIRRRCGLPLEQISARKGLRAVLT